MNTENGHVALPQLALFSRGDLSLWSRWKVERHVSHCEECSRLAREFAQVQEQLSSAAVELPANITAATWRSLASEMTANIHLAIAAGECVSVRPRLTERPRLVFAMAGMAVVLIVAVAERPQLSESTMPIDRQTGLTLEASGSEIAVHADGRMLAVPAPAGADVIQTVNTRGDMHSRYTDDTGVTINAVYADAE